MGEGFEIRNDVGYAGNLGVDIEAIRKGDGVGAVESVDGKGTEGASEEGADVDGEIEWLHAVDVEEEVGDDICVGVLRMERGEGGNDEGNMEGREGDEYARRWQR